MVQDPHRAVKDRFPCKNKKKRRSKKNFCFDAFLIFLQTNHRQDFDMTDDLTFVYSAASSWAR